MGKPTPVGSYLNGVGPYGAHDMAGNVWEWCATRWKNNYPGRRADVDDLLINVVSQWTNAYSSRGGSYDNSQKYVRGAYRNFFLARYRHFNRGLRVASRSPMPGSVS